MRPGSYIEFAKQIFHMEADRVLRDLQNYGDFRIGFASGGPVQAVNLPRTQRGESFFVFALGDRLHFHLLQPAYQLARQELYLMTCFLKVLLDSRAIAAHITSHAASCVNDIEGNDLRYGLLL